MRRNPCRPSSVKSNTVDRISQDVNTSICHIWQAHLHAFHASLGAASWPPKETIKIAPIRCALHPAYTMSAPLQQKHYFAPIQSSVTQTLHTSNGHGRVPLLKSLSALHTQASRPSALLGYLHNEHTHWRYVQATLPSPKSFLPIFYIKAELSTFH